jgi:poly(A) polymerase
MKTNQIFKIVAKVSEMTSTDVYIVGGYVRDEILGINHEMDLDFVVLGNAIEFAKNFDTFVEEKGSLVEFSEFDTARYVFADQSEIEFAGARSESYREHSRKPKVEPATLEEDLSRRDFRINAMARRVGKGGRLGKVVDPHDGQKDIKAKILQTPLDPNETFYDDPLRMIRAARFAARLGFGIEKSVMNAMEKNAFRLKIVSAERVKGELFRILKADVPSAGLWILYGTKLLDQFLPEISALHGVEEVRGYKHKDNLSHTFAVVDNIATQSDNILLRYTGLMHDVAKPATKKLVSGRGWTFDMHEHLGKKMSRQIARRLRLSTDDSKYVCKLVRWHLQPIALMDKGISDSPVRRLVLNLEDDLQDLLILCRSDITTGNQKKKSYRLKNYDLLEIRIKEVLEKDKLRAFQSPVRGEEIMDVCKLKSGMTVGKIKKEIERAILDGEIPNEYKPAREYFLKIKDKFCAKAGDWEKKF